MYYSKSPTANLNHKFLKNQKVTQVEIAETNTPWLVQDYYKSIVKAELQSDIRIYWSFKNLDHMFSYIGFI
jgi:hypothetical protein